MGEIYKANCSCGWNTELFLGAGMNATNIRFIQNYLNEKDAAEFIETFEKGLIKTFELSNVPYYSKENQTVGSISKFSYKLHSGQDIEIIGKCPPSENQIQLLKNDDIFCPICHNKVILEQTGHWD
jgi:hypothetical protein